MQVNHEIEARAPDLFDKLDDTHHSPRLRSVTQRDAINRERRIRIARKLYDGRAGFADGDSNACARESLADSGERGQAQDHIAELAEVYDEYVARIEIQVL